MARITIFEDETKIPKSIKVATLKLRLCDIAELADQVVKEMGTYNLVSENCQHFCNRLLQKMGQQTYPTTIGPKMTQWFVKSGHRLLLSIMPTAVGRVVASGINTALVET